MASPAHRATPHDGRTVRRAGRTRRRRVARVELHPILGLWPTSSVHPDGARRGWLQPSPDQLRRQSGWRLMSAVQRRIALVTTNPCTPTARTVRGGQCLDSKTLLLLLRRAAPPGVPSYQLAKGVGIHHPTRRRPVEPDAWRRACPVRRGLIGVNASVKHGGINPGVLPDGSAEAGRGGHARVAIATRVGQSEGGEVGGAPTESPAGVRAHRVRSTAAGVGSSRLVTAATGPMTRLGDRGETPGGEKLNHERPARACRSVRSKTEPHRERRVLMGRGELLVSAPRKRRYRAAATMPRGSADIRHRAGATPLAT